MKQQALLELLEQVRRGEVMPAQAAARLHMENADDNLGFARVDRHRQLRQGAAEVIYGEGKTPEQILKITESLLQSGQAPVLITRLSPAGAAALESLGEKLCYEPLSCTATVGELPEPDGNGVVVVATGGTTDIPVAEEAARTAEALGSRVVRLYDVGVSGIHRLLEQTETLQSAQVIVAVAGMEGALPSVVAGLVSCPVIAVPTSVGYGASFGGLAALLTMLNSCASGVSVVNIDNGFGAGFLANRINHMGVDR